LDLGFAPNSKRDLSDGPSAVKHKSKYTINAFQALRLASGRGIYFQVAESPFSIMLFVSNATTTLLRGLPPS
jgi:hypothetical protein